LFSVTSLLSEVTLTHALSLSLSPPYFLCKQNATMSLSFVLYFYCFVFKRKNKLYIKEKRIRSASRLPSNASWQSGVLGVTRSHSVLQRQMYSCQVMKIATWVRTRYSLSPRVVGFCRNKGKYLVIIYRQIAFTAANQCMFISFPNFKPSIYIFRFPS
jgi:hypothetical protein